MKMIFFGGIQGVGKTTLLSWLENQFKGQIVLLNPGELFRRYFYNEKITTIEEIEEMIVCELEKMPNDSTVVIHWHYAVRRPSGFIPQICFSRLKRIAESGKIEQVVLLQVVTSVNAVCERRLKDHQAKKRKLSQVAINEEVSADEEFLTKHKVLFSRVLGGKNVTVLRLVNDDLRATQTTLYKFFKTLLS